MRPILILTLLVASIPGKSQPPSNVAEHRAERRFGRQTETLSEYIAGGDLGVCAYNVEEAWNQAIAKVRDLRSSTDQTQIRSLRIAAGIDPGPSEKDQKHFSSLVTRLRSYLFAGGFLSPSDGFRTNAVAAVEKALQEIQEPSYRTVLLSFRSWLAGEESAAPEALLSELNFLPVFYPDESPRSRLCGLLTPRPLIYEAQARDEVRELAVAMAFLLAKKGKAAEAILKAAAGVSDRGLRDHALAALLEPYAEKKYHLPEGAGETRPYAEAVLGSLIGKSRYVLFSKKAQFKAAKVQDWNEKTGRLRISIPRAEGAEQVRLVEERREKENLDLSKHLVEKHLEDGILWLDFDVPKRPSATDLRGRKLIVKLAGEYGTGHVAVDLPHKKISDDLLSQITIDSKSFYKAMDKDLKRIGAFVLPRGEVSRAVHKYFRENGFECESSEAVLKEGLLALLKQEDKLDFLSIGNGGWTSPHLDLSGATDICRCHNNTQDQTIYILASEASRNPGNGVEELGDLLSEFQRTPPLVLLTSKESLALANSSSVRVLKTHEYDPVLVQWEKMAKGAGLGDEHRGYSFLEEKEFIDPSSSVESTEPSKEALAAYVSRNARIDDRVLLPYLKEAAPNSAPEFDTKTPYFFSSSEFWNDHWAEWEEDALRFSPFPYIHNLELPAAVVKLGTYPSSTPFFQAGFYIGAGDHALPRLLLNKKLTLDGDRIVELILSNRDSDFAGLSRLLSDEEQKNLESILLESAKSPIASVRRRAVKRLFAQPAFSLAALRALRRLLDAHLDLLPNHSGELQLDPNRLTPEVVAELEKWLKEDPDRKGRMVAQVLSKSPVPRNRLAQELVRAAEANRGFGHFISVARALVDMARKGEPIAERALVRWQSDPKSPFYNRPSFFEEQLGLAPTEFWPNLLEESHVALEAIVAGKPFPEGRKDFLKLQAKELLPELIASAKRFPNYSSVPEPIRIALLHAARTSPEEFVKHLPEKDRPAFPTSVLAEAYARVDGSLPVLRELVARESNPKSEGRLLAFAGILRQQGDKGIPEVWKGLGRDVEELLKPEYLRVLADAPEPVQRKICELLQRRRESLESLASVWGVKAGPCIATHLTMGGESTHRAMVALGKYPAVLLAYPFKFDIRGGQGIAAGDRSLLFLLKEEQLLAPLPAQQ